MEKKEKRTKILNRTSIRHKEVLERAYSKLLKQLKQLTSHSSIYLHFTTASERWLKTHKEQTEDFKFVRSILTAYLALNYNKFISSSEVFIDFSKENKYLVVQEKSVDYYERSYYYGYHGHNSYSSKTSDDFMNPTKKCSLDKAVICRSSSNKLKIGQISFILDKEKPESSLTYFDRVENPSSLFAQFLKNPFCFSSKKFFMDFFGQYRNDVFSIRLNNWQDIVRFEEFKVRCLDSTKTKKTEGILLKDYLIDLKRNMCQLCRKNGFIFIDVLSDKFINFLLNASKNFKNIRQFLDTIELMRCGIFPKQNFIVVPLRGAGKVDKIYETFKAMVGHYFCDVLNITITFVIYLDLLSSKSNDKIEPVVKLDLINFEKVDHRYFSSGHFLTFGMSHHIREKFTDGEELYEKYFCPNVYFEGANCENIEIGQTEDLNYLLKDGQSNTLYFTLDEMYERSKIFCKEFDNLGISHRQRYGKKSLIIFFRNLENFFQRQKVGSLQI